MITTTMTPEEVSRHIERDLEECRSEIRSIERNWKKYISLHGGLSLHFCKVYRLTCKSTHQSYILVYHWNPNMRRYDTRVVYAVVDGSNDRYYVRNNTTEYSNTIVAFRHHFFVRYAERINFKFSLDMAMSEFQRKNLAQLCVYTNNDKNQSVWIVNEGLILASSTREKWTIFGTFISDSMLKKNQLEAKRHMLNDFQAASRMVPYFANLGITSEFCLAASMAMQNSILEASSLYENFADD